ncbi:hypothetical protein [Xanthomonas tesorieronis]|uniref:hypothetical protein n=1 Tax=Xanthomonas tesorieronis TaxID=3160839 RepID=UPI0035179DD6
MTWRYGRQPGIAIQEVCGGCLGLYETLALLLEYLHCRVMDGFFDLFVAKKLRPWRVVDDGLARLARKFLGDHLRRYLADRAAIEDASFPHGLGGILARDGLDFLERPGFLDLLDLFGIVVAHDVAPSSVTRIHPSL